MLCLGAMDPTGKYSLSITGTLVLTLSAQSLLLMPEAHASLLGTLPVWAVDLLGFAFYLLGIFLIASIFLGYTRAAQTWIYLSSAVGLLVIGWECFQTNSLVEGFVILGLALAFFLSNWLQIKRDWMVETIQWLNLLIGTNLLAQPLIFMATPPDAHFAPALTVFAVFLLLSGLFSLFACWAPALSNLKMGRFLAVPWALWGLLFSLPIHWLNLSVALSIILGLVLSEFIPWEKLALFLAV